MNRDWDWAVTPTTSAHRVGYVEVQPVERTR